MLNADAEYLIDKSLFINLDLKCEINATQTFIHKKLERCLKEKERLPLTP